MKINITNKQYKSLMKLAYLGNWLANASRGADETIAEFEDITQYVFSFVREYHLESWVERHDESDKWFPTKELEERLSPLIDEYNEDNFWEDLVFDLARRDLIDRYGEDEVEKMDLKELITREQPFLDKYEQEFSKNGIRNLRIE